MVMGYTPLVLLIVIWSMPIWLILYYRWYFRND
jgi:hypothetical protein